MNLPSDLGENQLLALCVRAATWIVVVSILSIAAYVIHNDYRRSLALAKGVDPVAVDCAFSGIATSCALAAGSRRPSP